MWLSVVVAVGDMERRSPGLLAKPVVIVDDGDQNATLNGTLPDGVGLVKVFQEPVDSSLQLVPTSTTALVVREGGGVLLRLRHMLTRDGGVPQCTCPVPESTDQIACAIAGSLSVRAAAHRYVPSARPLCVCDSNACVAHEGTRAAPGTRGPSGRHAQRG